MHWYAGPKRIVHATVQTKNRREAHLCVKERMRESERERERESERARVSKPGRE